MPNAVAIFIDRFFLGAATAAIMSAGVALITVFFDGEKQLKMIAVQGCGFIPEKRHSGLTCAVDGIFRNADVLYCDGIAAHLSTE